MYLELMNRLFGNIHSNTEDNVLEKTGWLFDFFCFSKMGFNNFDRFNLAL